MNEKMRESLNEISDKHISEAADYRRRKPYWLGAVAAMLAAVILLGVFWKPIAEMPPIATQPGTQPPLIIRPNTPLIRPGAIQVPSKLELINLVNTITYPTMAACPDFSDYSNDYKAYNEAYNAWTDSRKSQHNQPDGYADNLTDFFSRSISRFLQGDGNRAYSPLNYYMALSILAETAQGDSRQQILDLLGIDSIEALRTQVGHVWNAHYNNDGKNTTLLSNSLWLDDAYQFHQTTIDTLGNYHHASIFHGDLGTESLNQQLRSWINSQTGGLLENQTQHIELDPDTVFALCSTIYFKSTWVNTFSKDATKNAIFHCTDKDISTPFMNDSFSSTYYRGENFGAIQLPLSDGSSMWLILPDKGSTVQDILAGNEYLQMTLDPDHWDHSERRIINLSMPKFDISSQTDLIEGTKELGVTDVFSAANADLKNLVDLSDTEAANVYVKQIKHGVRIAIDEEGIAAAAYTVMLPAGALPPPETLEFTLDRPFLFVVSSEDHLPLFAGTVMEP